MPLQIIRQDITKMQVDAIVNTTNEEMVGYSGVDLAIHTVAGSGMDEECESLPPLMQGRAQITGGYALPCKYVIHTSGPIWHGGKYGEAELLRSCYLESLKLAVRHECHTVAFPLISAGVYGFPKDQVLKFAIGVITEFLLEHELTVYLCVYDKESYSFSQKLFQDIKAFIDDEYAETHDGYFYEPDETVPPSPSPERSGGTLGQSLQEYMKGKNKSFGDVLFALIDESGMTDVECYKRANVDKRVFSKIKSNRDYRPSKQTAIAFALALRLDIEKTQGLLAAAGLVLSENQTFDRIILYFLQNRVYDVFEINEALFAFEQPLLGSVSNEK